MKQHEFQYPKVTELSQPVHRPYGIFEHDTFSDGLELNHSETEGMEEDVATFAKRLAREGLAQVALKDVSLPDNVIPIETLRERNRPSAA